MHALVTDLSWRATPQRKPQDSMRCVEVCSIWRCVAVSCSELQCGQTSAEGQHHSSKSGIKSVVEQCVAVCCSRLQCVAACADLGCGHHSRNNGVCCSALVRCSVLQCIAERCSVLQRGQTSAGGQCRRRNNNLQQHTVILNCY